MMLHSSNTIPREIKLFYQIYDGSNQKPHGAILMDIDTDPEFGQDIIDDLVRRGLWNETLEQQLENKQFYFKIFRDDVGEIPDDAIMMEKVRIIPNKGLTSLEEAMGNTWNSSLKWLDSFVPERIKQSVDDFGNSVAKWAEDKLTGLSSYSSIPVVEELDEEKWHEIVRENSVVENQLDADAGVDSIEPSNALIRGSAQPTIASTSFLDSLINTASSFASYAYSNPFKTLTLALAASSVVNNVNLPKFKSNTEQALLNSISTTTGFLTKLAVANAVTQGQNPILKTVIVGLPFYQTVSAITCTDTYVTLPWTGQHIDINDPPNLEGSGGSILFYEDNVPIVIDSNIDLCDADNNIGGAIIKISGNLVSSEDRLSFVSSGGVTGSYDIATGKLTLTGTATVATYKAILRGVMYQNLSNNPSVLARTISFLVTDVSGAPSSEIIRTINIITNPDRPTLSLSGGSSTSTFTENGPDLSIAPTLALIDSDSSNMFSAMAKISNNFVAGQDFLTFTTQPGITGNFNAVTGEVLFTGVASKSAYETTLRSLKFRNTSEDPSALARTITILVNDGGLDSTTLTLTVNVVSVPDKPTLSLNGASSTITFTENDPDLSIASTITVADVDSPNLVSATVKISNNFAAGQDSLTFTTQPGITGNFNAATGEVLFTGTASKLAYETTLRSLKFRNTSEDPSTLARTITIVVNDGGLDSIAVTRTINVVSVPDKPTLSGSTSTLTFTEGDPDLSVASSVTISDVDSSTLVNATISISNNFAAGQDFLTFTAQPGITGNYNTTTGVLTLIGPASKSAFETTIRTIKFRNTSENPSTSARKIAIVVNDGGLNSLTFTRNINVVSVPDKPTLSLNATSSASTFTEGDPDLSIASTIIIDDVDSLNLVNATVSISGNFTSGQDFLTFTTQPGITGNFNATTGVLTFTGTASKLAYETTLRTIKFRNTSENPSTLERTITIVVNDGGLNSIPLNCTVNVVSVSDRPTLSLNGTSSNLTFTEGDPPLLVAPTLIVNDVDSSNLVGATVRISSNFTAGQDFLRFTNQSGITGNYNATTGILTFSGTASRSAYEAALHVVGFENISENPNALSKTIEVVVNDGGLNSAPLTRTINVVSVPDRPILSLSGGALTFKKGDPVLLVAPTLIVNDVDSTNLVGVMVRISSNFTAGEDFLRFTNQSGITGNYNITRGILNFTGTASRSAYEAAIRKVGYENTSENPTSLLKMIEIVANDGGLNSTPLTRTIQVVPANKPSKLPSKVSIVNPPLDPIPIVAGVGATITIAAIALGFFAHKKCLKKNGIQSLTMKDLETETNKNPIPMQTRASSVDQDVIQSLTVDVIDNEIDIPKPWLADESSSPSPGPV
jgi:hypothetical protein